MSDKPLYWRLFISERQANLSWIVHLYQLPLGLLKLLPFSHVTLSIFVLVPGYMTASERARELKTFDMGCWFNMSWPDQYIRKRTRNNNCYNLFHRTLSPLNLWSNKPPTFSFTPPRNNSVFHLARWKPCDIFLSSGGILICIWLAAFCKPKLQNSCHIRWKCKQINYDPMGWEHPAQSTLTETFIRNNTTATVSQLVAQTAAKQPVNMS